MPYPLPLTRTEAYLAYKAGIVQLSDLKPSLAVPRNGIDAWLAYWTGLAEDYPKREDGTPHILQEEEAYIAYLCGVINEYPEKCLRRVGAYLRYLISARWGRPDRPLNREELYLSLLKTQVIPSGDPSSDIVIDGTAKAPFVDVKMYGDTFQQSYTGKNLLAIVRRTAETKNGVTCTWNGASFTLDGTSTASTDFYGRGWWGTTSDPIALPAGTYTISLRKSDGSLATDANFSIDCYYGATHILGIYRGQSGAGFSTVTFDSDTQYSVLYISLMSGKTYNNEKFYFQLEKSDLPTSYEPYVGGQPSPNPEYPQQIQTVTGEQVVEIVGINILSSTWEDGGLDGATGEEAPYSNTVRTADFVKVEPSETYILSRGGAGVAMNVFRYGSDKSFLYSSTISAGNVFTTSAQTQYVKLFRNSTGGTEQMQLQKGSTITPYAPYSKHTYKINLGKNLYDGSVYKTGYILSATGSEVYSDGAVITEQMEVEPNTVYTASAIWKSSVMGDTYIRIGVYDASMGWIVRYSGVPDKITFTTPANARYVRLSYYRDRTDSVQLELGSTATSYAPYSTPIKLCNIGDYQDYIYNSGDKWFKHSDIGKITLDGSQDITTLGDGAGGIKRFRYANETIRNISTSKRGVYCDIYQGMQYNGASYVPNSIAQWESQNMFAITTASTTYSVNDFKAALSSNPATIYYALATPTDTEITNQNLIDQLNALKQGGAEEGTTYIKVSATEPNLPGLLYVEAPKYE